MGRAVYIYRQQRRLLFMAAFYPLMNGVVHAPFSKIRIVPVLDRKSGEDYGFETVVRLTLKRSNPRAHSCRPTKWRVFLVETISRRKADTLSRRPVFIRFLRKVMR